MKILIVDDEVPIRKYITQMITECGKEYEVIGSVNSAKKGVGSDEKSGSGSHICGYHHAQDDRAGATGAGQGRAS